MRYTWVGAFVFLVAIVTTGCESRTAIPPGAQQVRVTTTPTSVQLTPASVHAGDVYLVLDPLPSGIVLAFVQSATSSGAGPLSSADLARLAQNADAEGLGTETLDISCCGNVYKETLVPGKYALVVDDAQRQPGSRPLSIAVLDVQP
jgi:hypothetical protein